ncbi:MAG: hypothetical protein IJW92_00620 [Clostridia bacterium]|nr:hypothetical protein [Clostridia bacterium]
MKQQDSSYREEKSEAGEIALSNPVIKWLDNFWYHYKWTVIFCAFVLMVIVVCFAQCTQTVTTDQSVTFAGAKALSEDEIAAVQDVLNLIGEKNTADGEDVLTVGLLTYSVFTEEELRAMYTDEDGNFSEYAYNSAKQANSDRLNNFSSFLTAGVVASKCSIWLVSEYVYEYRNMKALAVPLANSFETAPAGAYDDYAIRLGDTELYQYYDALKALPADTLIVLTVIPEYANDTAQQSYVNDVALYKSLVEFRAP